MNETQLIITRKANGQTSISGPIDNTDLCDLMLSTARRMVWRRWLKNEDRASNIVRPEVRIPQQGYRP